MEFGRLPTVDGLDFSLPPDHRQTSRILQQTPPNTPTDWVIGCAKWGRPDWVGKLYPKGTKNKDYLAAYAKQFSAIELNATHYSRFTADALQKWDEDTPTYFRFFPKFHQSISHWKRLQDAEAETRQFFESLQPIEHKIGGYFLQLNENFGSKSSDTILRYLAALPEREQVYLELRHPDFFKETAALETFYEELTQLKVGLLITDAAGKRDCVHMRLTTPKAFIRFVGNGLHPSDYTRMNDWVIRLKEWSESGLENAYFFMHQHDELYSPEAVDYFVKELNSACKLTLRGPQLIGKEQGLLF